MSPPNLRISGNSDATHIHRTCGVSRQGNPRAPEKLLIRRERQPKELVCPHVAKVALAVAFAGCALALLVWWRFEADMAAARDRASQGSTVVQTNCGPIEYQEKGSGVPLLSVHGSGGGFDQGMAFAGGLAGRGTRVIAMSRFGYGTFAGAEYTAGQIKGARFIGFDQGGHTFVGHEDEVMVAILGLLLPAVPVAAP